MFGRKFKIDNALYERLGVVAQKKGYASTDEMIHHLLEREAGSAEDSGVEREVEQQLRGLGYIE